MTLFFIERSIWPSVFLQGSYQRLWAPNLSALCDYSLSLVIAVQNLLKKKPNKAIYSLLVKLVNAVAQHYFSPLLPLLRMSSSPSVRVGDKREGKKCLMRTPAFHFLGVVE